MYIPKKKLFEIRRIIAILATWFFILFMPCLLLWIMKSRFHIASLWLLIAVYPILLALCFLLAGLVKNYILFPLILGKDAHHVRGEHEDAIIGVEKLLLQEQFQLHDVVTLLHPIPNPYTDELISILESCRDGATNWISTQRVEPYRKQVVRLMNRIVDKDFV